MCPGPKTSGRALAAPTTTCVELRPGLPLPPLRASSSSPVRHWAPPPSVHRPPALRHITGHLGACPSNCVTASLITWVYSVGSLWTSAGFYQPPHVPPANAWGIRDTQSWWRGRERQPCLAGGRPCSLQGARRRPEDSRGLRSASPTPAAHAPGHFRREPTSTFVDPDLAMPAAFPNLKTGPLGTEMPSHQASLKEGSQEHEPERDVRQRPLKAIVCMFRALLSKE